MTEQAHPEWDASYTADTPAPWDIGRPQPAFVRLADEGRLTGRLLDAGRGRRPGCAVPVLRAPGAGRGEERAAQVTAARPPCDEEPPGEAEGGDRRRQGRGSAAHGPYAICWCPQAGTTGAGPAADTLPMTDHYCPRWLLRPGT